MALPTPKPEPKPKHVPFVQEPQASQEPETLSDEPAPVGVVSQGTDAHLSPAQPKRRKVSLVHPYPIVVHGQCPMGIPLVARPGMTIELDDTPWVAHQVKSGIFKDE